MKVLDLAIDLATGPAREVRTVLADDRRKLVAIVLREGSVLGDHSAVHPITIHCLAGAGTLVVGSDPIALAPGRVVALDPGVVHAVHATPNVAVLVTMFRAGQEKVAVEGG